MEVVVVVEQGVALVAVAEQGVELVTVVEQGVELELGGHSVPEEWKWSSTQSSSNTSTAMMCTWPNWFSSRGYQSK